MSATIYFDLETAGLLPHHPNIQLAAVAVEDCNGAELASFECKLEFNEADADPEALKMNHYTPEAWEDALPVTDAVRRFCEFARPHRCVQMISKRTGEPYQVSKLAGYNALTFDLPRLRQMFGTQFFPFSYHVYDVLQRVLFWFDENPGAKPESLKLTTVCQYFGIETDEAHDALADVRLTAALRQRLRSGR